MDTQTMRGMLVESDAATIIYLLEQKYSYILEVDEKSVFILDQDGRSEERLAFVKEEVIKFKHRYSYEKPKETM